ncbi:MAG TPA: enoyl-CoA hydratase/isomerase family protein [Leptospiraceae bacterium]|nr:enoyl-CoA hydratase/isomerase family protein [Leptospiraceae bacterium]HMW04288.1 enoyl-CoA hydratase/isomerase family protein [Leptospiraceae bacterium]HMX30634.1 enoyl-CoA hydratase/isomerase family protein [Leptospiraceae bacterium]HMY31334.1 enoyl-CoA hydratase/isomerase family protein [Leptospiraceae bacterium]HMZ63629.1 enoyl-CoA hydratase/isomerase family protein [Leptospiraceae bacterium]
MNPFKVENQELKGGKTAFIGIQTSEQNTVTRDQILELQRILTDLDKDSTVRGIVIHSENEKFFCNGMDAKHISTTPKDRLAEEMGEIIKFFVFMSEIYKPLVAEISGYAMGGGAVLSLACDYRMMLTGKARISFTEVFFGLPLPGVLIEKCKMAVLPQHVNDVIYGTNYKAEEAKEIGFIHEIADNKEDLRKLTVRKLENLYKFPLSAFQKTKESLHYHLSQYADAHMKALDANFQNPVIQKNLMEAMNAFQEKRRPNFS